MFLEEERPQNGGGDYQKDTGSEPRTGSFTRVGVARTELLIYLDSADEADYSTDCINQFCAGIEISGHELCRFGDACPFPCAIAALAAATAASIIINLFFFIYFRDFLND